MNPKMILLTIATFAGYYYLVKKVPVIHTVVELSLATNKILEIAQIVK